MLRTAQWIANATGGRLIGNPEQLASHVVTDSREATPGSLYIARVGENSDGHTYIDAAIAQGACMLIVEREIAGLEVPQIIVEDATIALGAMARQHIAELREVGNLQILAVTGSAGKTTTKDLLAQIFSSVAPTVAPRLSFNNEVGAPLTMLQTDETTRFLVLEMGASGPGHLRYLTEIVAPDVAIELMVGHAHLGGFGSVQGVADAKAELIEGMRPGGTALLNADDTYVRAMAQRADGNVEFFSVSANEQARFVATDVEIGDDERARFILLDRQSGLQAPVQVQLVGAHHVSNALAAASAAILLGIELEHVAQVLSASTAQSPHRMALSDLTLEGQSVTLIDDSYNANSDSMRAALHTLKALRKGRKSLAVLGEMLELGQASADIHTEVGQWAVQAGVDAVVALGEDAQHYITELPDHVVTVYAHDADEALRATLTLIDAPSIILVKGSNGSGAWRVADALNERGQGR